MTSAVVHGALALCAATLAVTAVGPTAARETASQVSGPYRFEIVPAVGHFMTSSRRPSR